jgi:hypothetical protein
MYFEFVLFAQNVEKLNLFSPRGELLSSVGLLDEGYAIVSTFETLSIHLYFSRVGRRRFEPLDWPMRLARFARIKLGLAVTLWPSGRPDSHSGGKRHYGLAEHICIRSRN